MIFFQQSTAQHRPIFLPKMTWECTTGQRQEPIPDPTLLLYITGVPGTKKITLPVLAGPKTNFSLIFDQNLSCFYEM